MARWPTRARRDLTSGGAEIVMVLPQWGSGYDSASFCRTTGAEADHLPLRVPFDVPAQPQGRMGGDAHPVGGRTLVAVVIGSLLVQPGDTPLQLGARRKRCSTKKEGLCPYELML